MDNRESLQTRKIRTQELASFRSGEAYGKLRAEYEAIIRSQNLTIKKLQKERDDFSFSRKKIINNREKSGKRSGAQPGHPHHPRRRMEPDQVVLIPAGEGLENNPRYVPTGELVSRQQQHGSHVLCEGLELVQEMIHENNDAPAEGIAEGKIAEFEEGMMPSSGQPRKNMRMRPIRVLPGWV